MSRKKASRPGNRTDATTSSRRLFLGTKGAMLVTGSHNSSAVLIPDSRRKAFGRPKLLVPKSRGHFDELVRAAKGQLPWDAPLSNFTYAGHMTAVLQLGNAALKASKPTLEIDPKTHRRTPHIDTQRAANRPTHGWKCPRAHAALVRHERRLRCRESRKAGNCAETSARRHRPPSTGVQARVRRPGRRGGLPAAGSWSG